jgi:protein-tyrosine phosphatase
MLMSKLTWMEFFRLVGLMVIGHRKDAIKVLSPHMNEMGLPGLATSSLEACKREVKQVFDVLADEHSLPVLVHCTQGKDRTGLVVMLVLFLLAVDPECISMDYLLSESELAPEMESRLKELASIGLTEQFAVCTPNAVEGVQAHLEEHYGSTPKPRTSHCIHDSSKATQTYLESAGISREALEHMKRMLLV